LPRGAFRHAESLGNTIMTITRRRMLLAILPLAMLSALPALAQTAPAGDIVIEKPWARAAIQGGTGGAFLTIRNTGSQADRLLSASSPLPRLTEVHTTMREGDVMRMAPVGALEIPAGGTVALQPGGLHIMLVGLSQAIRPGETLTLTLNFEHAGAITLQVPVQAAGSSGPAAGHAHH
jgi:copper(I)-binding protein